MHLRIYICIYLYNKTYCIRVSHTYALDCVYRSTLKSHIQKCDVKLQEGINK